MGVSLWEALLVVSQKWSPFPTALGLRGLPKVDTFGGASRELPLG